MFQRIQLNARRILTASVKRPAWRYSGLMTLFAVAAGAAALTTGWPWDFPALQVEDLNQEPVLQAGVLAAPPRLQEVSGIFKKNETITDALRRHGLTFEQIQRLVQRARPVYNLARIRAQHPYRLHFTESGDFRDFIYPVDDERYLTVYSHGADLQAVMKNFRYDSIPEAVLGTIDDSLFAAVIGGGEQDQLAIDLADIFMWDVDFYTDIQKNDSFRLLVEKKYLDGQFKKYGPILAAELTVQNKTFTAYRFQDGSPKPTYYSFDGKALNKSFLKSPLRFTRISSGFSLARKHPILRIVRPHQGVDYAAPAGMPVVAVASGKVIYAGWRSDYGNLVHLRHAQGYVTMYAHLSRILVPVGAQVAQGDPIGRVGSTGLATGPHLDFRVLQRGQFINPRKVVVEPEPPVSKEGLPRFIALRDELKDRLDQVTLMGAMSSR